VVWWCSVACTFTWFIPMWFTFFGGTLKVKCIALGLWPSRTSSKEYGTKFRRSQKKWRSE
jgi:hypothetical protein